MCGIAGFVGTGPLFASDACRSYLRNMTDQISPRGPDAEGHWISNNAPVALGHRRLSILDLSAAGAQPMMSHCERYVISYNGEVYNSNELRETLGSVDWRGTSDTEVLLAMIAHFGLPATLQKLDGMFAFALFDRKEHSLTLARDKFGEKPLFYGRHLGHLVFASQLHAFRGLPDFAPQLNPEAVQAFFAKSNVSEPFSICSGIHKLSAGHFIKFDAHNIKDANSTAYWTASTEAMDARRNPFSGSIDDAEVAVKACLTKSVQRRMISDVPLGSLLSGGIDSSLTTAFMQKLSSKPVKTFTIGMAQEGFDESEHARLVSEHLGTDHSELILTPEQVLESLPKMASIYDEPFADASQIPTYLVSKLARQNVTVALSGDGADELFGGYNRHFHGERLWNKLRKIPRPLRRSAGAILDRTPVGVLDTLGNSFGSTALKSGRTSEKIKKLGRLMQSKNATEFYHSLLSTANDPSSVLHPDIQRSLPLPHLVDGFSFAEQMMINDTVDFLPNDVLTKTDRASMAESLELRTPFLSSEIFELAWNLPMGFKTGPNQGKLVLRNLLYTMVPRELVDRPKAGFTVPIGRWLRTDLLEWAEDTLSPTNLKNRGIYNVSKIQKLWHQHKKGQTDNEAILWSILMFEGWVETTHLAKA